MKNSLGRHWFCCCVYPEIKTSPKQKNLVCTSRFYGETCFTLKCCTYRWVEVTWNQKDSQSSAQIPNLPKHFSQPMMAFSSPRSTCQFWLKWKYNYSQSGSGKMGISTAVFSYCSRCFSSQILTSVARAYHSKHSFYCSIILRQIKITKLC